MGFVVFVNFIAKCLPLCIEDHGHKFFDAGIAQVVQELHQHVGKTVDSIDGRTVWARHRRERMVGAKNITRTVDQVETPGFF